MYNSINISTVSIDNLGIGYDPSNYLLPKFSVDAHQGELIALVGRNGIGKSTLLRTIMGLHVPFEGGVSITGKSVKGLLRKERSRLLSFVPADTVKIPNLFIRDFIALSRFPYTGWSRKLSVADWDMVDFALQQVGISHLSHRDITTASDGERQRAMIAFALAQDAKIILLDEPTAYLDLPNKYEVVHLLSQLAHSRNKTIIYSTHDLQGAISEADNIWMMLDTGFVAGAPEDIALSNGFNQFLANTNMMFDTSLGLFKNQRNPEKSIAIEGQGDALLWTKRLAERLGFACVERSNAEIMVSCSKTDNGSLWEVYQQNGLVTKVHSLTELGQLFKELHKLKP
ncbi:MAG: ABC transporter ATP-binding protein [Bacteroidales bacterium]